MIVSEARILANRANGAKGRGPTTPEGKERSRRNGLKHGLSGRGVVTPEVDRDEAARRAEALAADLKPISQAGALLVDRMAAFSVRVARAAEHESAAIALKVRHAADDFDERRIEQAHALFASLGDDPRENLRKLLKSPEGVDRLVDAWGDLRADLAIDPSPEWTAGHLERAANLLGLGAKHARSTRLGALSRAYWGDFAALGDGEGGGLDEEFRREWARSMLFERIDAEVAALEAHCETLDFEAIDLDRAEAGSRALFDPSKEATLARRYESEASRGFFKALKEFRRVEAERLATIEEAPPEAPAPAPAPSPPRPEAEMGSSRENPPTPDRAPAPAPAEAPAFVFSAACDRDGQPLRVILPARTTG